MGFQYPLSSHALVANFIIDIRDPDYPSIALFHKIEKHPMQGDIPCPLLGIFEEGKTTALAAAVKTISESTGMHAPKDLSLHLSGSPFVSRDETLGLDLTVYTFSWFLKADQDNPPIKDARAKDGKTFHFGIYRLKVNWKTPRDILARSNPHTFVSTVTNNLWRVWLGDGSIFPLWTSTTMHKAHAVEMLSICLENLRQDKTSGARKLADCSLRYLLELSRAMFQGPTKLEIVNSPIARWKMICMVTWHLIENGRVGMNAATRTALLQCLNFIKPHMGDPTAILERIEIYTKIWKSNALRISEQFAEYIEQNIPQLSPEPAKLHPESGYKDRFNFNRGKRTVRIMTNSSGSNLRGILAALRKCDDVHFEIRILESRPLCEGASLGTRLIEEATREGTIGRLEIIVASDASAAILARGVNFLIIGADKISTDGDVYNKIGSLPAVLSAKAISDEDPKNNMQIIVLAGTEKVMLPSRTQSFVDENNCPHEIIQGWRKEEQDIGILFNSSRTRIMNKYFEWVPSKYINIYVSEHGVTDKRIIKEQSRFIQNLHTEIFNGI